MGTVEADRIADPAVRLAEAQRALAAAVRASRAKIEFVSRLSHELRTPLNSILGFAQLLELSPLAEPDLESVALILRAGRHLLDLVDDALDLSRVETGQLSLSLEPVEVAGVVAETFELVRPAAAARDVTLAATAGLLADDSVRADRQRLKQVLVNLVGNAVKYNRDGGVVTVDCGRSTGRENGWLRLTVSDTGPGIPADRLADVFRPSERAGAPFERAGAERTAVEGSGIGLSLAHSLVEAMGGRIGVRSTVGTGSTFHVDLPLAVSGPPGSAPGPWPTVLYVEDNPSNVTLMERVFAQRLDARLVVAGDGMSGLAAARREPPDLMLLDLHLPQLDGMRVLSALRHDDDPRLRALPIVIVTADLSPGTEQRLLSAGATAFLAKPFGVGELLDLVRSRLGQPPA